MRLRVVVYIAVLLASTCAATLSGVSRASAEVQCPLGQTEANGTEANNWPLGGGTGRCVTWSQWLEERKAADAAHEAAEKASEKARQEREAREKHQEELEEKKETGGPPTYLNVTPISVHGRTYANPGHSVLYIGTDRYATVYLKMWWPQYHAVKPVYAQFKFRFEGEEEEWEGNESDAEIYSWACGQPANLIWAWKVKAVGETNGEVEEGPGLERTGHFTTHLTHKWCRAAKRREEAATLWRLREEIRRAQREEREQQAAARHRAEQEYAEHRRFEENCRALGGTPVGIETSEGPETVCRAQGGGLLRVPT